MRFEQGTISHHDILNQNLAVQLGFDKERTVQLPESIVEVKNSYEKDNDIRIDDIEPIFLGENILKGVSLALGAFIFLAYCTFILYLKCRTRVNYNRPYLTTHTREPPNRSLMVHYSRAGAIPQLTENSITELDHVSLHPEQSLESDALNTTYILTRDSRLTVVPTSQTNSLLGGYSQL